MAGGAQAMSIADSGPSGPSVNGLANGHSSSSDYKLGDFAIDEDRRLRVVVVGCGFSGICAGIRFPQRMKNVDLTIYEKHPNVGGAWCAQYLATGEARLTTANQAYQQIPGSGMRQCVTIRCPQGAPELIPDSSQSQRIRTHSLSSQIRTGLPSSRPVRKSASTSKASRQSTRSCDTSSCGTR